MGNASSNPKETVIETTKSISWDIGESTFIKSLKEKPINQNDETSTPKNISDENVVKLIQQKDWIIHY
jgi:hypothetical protein